MLGDSHPGGQSLGHDDLEVEGTSHLFESVLLKSSQCAHTLHHADPMRRYTVCVCGGASLLFIEWGV